MIRSRIFSTAILLFVSVSIFAGPVSKEYKVQFKQAMTYIQDAQYADALPILFAMNQVNNNANNDFNIGLCQFYLQFDKATPLVSFDKAAKNLATKYRNDAENIQAPNEAVYFQALCYHHLGQNDKATAKYQEYINNSKTMSSDALIIKDAKRKLKLISETPTLFTEAENQEIANGRITSKKTETDYKSKLTKVMEVMQEDKIEAMMMLKPMLKDNPNEPNINYMMGICMLNMKPYNEMSTDYFMVADKNSSSFKEFGVGLDCPAIVKYYLGVSNQAKGNHKEALANFAAFNAVYPQQFLAFKPEFQKRVDYSQNMLNVASTDIASYNKQLDIVDTAGLKILFPIMGTPVSKDNSSTSTSTAKSGDVTYYYSVQVGAGNMEETYFDKVTDLRTATYPSGMKRFLTGKFSSNEEAVTRMNELQGLGYTDAFVTRMRGVK